MDKPRLLLIIAAVLFASPAIAFEHCDRVFKDSRHFVEEAMDIAVGRAPVRYHQLASSIRIVVDAPPSTLIPFATEQQGTKLVVLPIPFISMSCQMALATYLRVAGVQPESFEQAERAGAKCLDAGNPRAQCLTAFGNDLAARYRAAFAKLPKPEQNTALGIYRSALRQVLQHEYAHHYLNHFARIGASTLKRIDAEFEADLFAITNGVQSGDPVTAMYYFFDGLSGIEKSTRTLSTPDYESGACRASNINNITGFIGIVPVLLLDAAYGGNWLLQNSNSRQLRTEVDKHFGRAAPKLESGACALIANVALSDMHAELKQLALRMSADADLLFADQSKVDNRRASELVRDLAAMASRFRYADGVASKSIAMMLINWGLKGRARTPLMAQVESLLADKSVVANFQSEDYGRLLSAQSLALLQERTDLSPQARLDRSFSLLKSAVHYNPRLSEAWMNLAFVSFKRADCAAAARYGANSAATLTEGKDAQEGVATFVRTMKAWSANPEACRAEAARFSPYPGL